MLARLPALTAFRHTEVRDGFETVFFRDAPEAATVLEGATSAVEDWTPWTVNYRVAVDASWRTTLVEATGISPTGHHVLQASCTDGRWIVDGQARHDLDGCVVTDFESSLVTNTLAVHRIDPSATTPVDVPAAFVRADDLRVERLEQTYLCVEHNAERLVVDYTSPTFDFASQLVFDASGLISSYPGIDSRHT